MARVEYKDGIYYGELVNGKRQGFGKMTFDNGRYEGYWHNDKKHGKGKYSWTNGYYYDGDWEENLIQGYGKHTYPWGYYEGYWKNDIWFGKGVEVIIDRNTTIEGIWNGDSTATEVVHTQNGIVEYGRYENYRFIPSIPRKQYKNGYYQGDLVNDLPEGQGKFVWDDGDSYVGQWSKGARQGMGKQTYPWGYYEGMWQNNKGHGKGVKYLKEGYSIAAVWSTTDNAPTATLLKNHVYTVGKMVNGEFIPNN